MFWTREPGKKEVPHENKHSSKRAYRFFLAQQIINLNTEKFLTPLLQYHKTMIQRNFKKYGKKRGRKSFGAFFFSQYIL